MRASRREGRLKRFRQTFLSTRAQPIAGFHKSSASDQMGIRDKSRRPLQPGILKAVGACLLLSVFPLLASGTPQNGPAKTEDADKSSQQISLTAFGNKGLSPLSRFTTQNDLTINFLDNDHVLCTSAREKPRPGYWNADAKRRGSV